MPWTHRAAHLALGQRPSEAERLDVARGELSGSCQAGVDAGAGHRTDRRSSTAPQLPAVPQAQPPTVHMANWLGDGRGVPQRSGLPNTPATGDRSLAHVASVCGGAPTGHRLDLVALQGAVDSGAGDAEEVGEFGGAVLALPEQAHQVGWTGRPGP